MIYIKVFDFYCAIFNCNREYAYLYNYNQFKKIEIL